MRAVRSVKVVEALPIDEFCFEINIAFVAEQLIEFLSIRPMRAFHFAVQLGRTALDIGVANSKILDMPMEFCLELMAIVRPDFSDAEWEFFNDMINEVDRVGLGVFLVNFQRPNPRCIIDSCMLKTAHFVTLFTFESQDLTSIWM